jgi:hypothetical protein
MLVDGSGGALAPLDPTGPVPRSAGCGIAVADAPAPLAPVPPTLAAVTDGGLAADAVLVGANDDALDPEPVVEPLAAGIAD